VALLECRACRARISSDCGKCPRCACDQPFACPGCGRIIGGPLSGMSPSGSPAGDPLCKYRHLECQMVLRCRECGAALSSDVSDCAACGCETPFVCSECRRQIHGPLKGMTDAERRASRPLCRHTGLWCRVTLHCRNCGAQIDSDCPECPKCGCRTPLTCAACGKPASGPLTGPAMARREGERPNPRLWDGNRPLCEAHQLEPCLRCGKWLPRSQLEPRVVEWVSTSNEHVGSWQPVTRFFCPGCATDHRQPKDPTPLGVCRKCRRQVPVTRLAPMTMGWREVSGPDYSTSWERETELFCDDCRPRHREPEGPTGGCVGCTLPILITIAALVAFVSTAWGRY
jgi:hypothetical protein